MKRTLAVLALTLIAVGGQSAATEETIAIDVSAPSRPFPHFWEEAFGSGRAVLSLRQSYRRDLAAVKEITNFQYVRFHAILDDEIGLYDETPLGDPIYNFSYVDEIYDGLLEQHVRPFVELSFMPRALAANLAPHPFWYKPLPSPPKDIDDWAGLVEAFTKHLLDRYGSQEVEQWYFEVWNEPNIDFWNGVPKQSTYFELYDATAAAIKNVDARLRVGGPATAQAAWVDAFLAHCAQNHIPFDFVSTHIYGNENPVDVFGRPEPITRRDMVARAARKVYDQVKASAAPGTPIIWSEYNATYMNQPQVTDSAFMGPWLANNIRECDGLTRMMSYWTFSDVFEEQGVVKRPFYGGYGLIAERGIPKPAFRAFELLHKLGDKRLPVDSENALVTVRNDGTLVVALWNYAEPEESAPAKSFRLEVKGPAAKDAVKHYRVQFIDPEHGSPLRAWDAMGSPRWPSMEQIRKLTEASRLTGAADRPIGEPITLAAQGLAVAVLEP